MQVKIETINDKQCTVIYKPFDAEWVEEQIDMEQTVLVKRHNKGCLLTLWNHDHCGNFQSTGLGFHHPDNFESIVTILPALPRYPNKKDALLVYRYMAEGLEVIATATDTMTRYNNCEISAVSDNTIDNITNYTITHATLPNGERVEIAIEG